MKTMCTCGAAFEAPTVEEAWHLLEQHTDDAHGRAFPAGAFLGAGTHKTRRRTAPITTQGGES